MLAYFTLCFFIFSFSQPGTWVAVYGGMNYDRGQGICQTPDSGFIIGATTSSYGMGSTDFYLLKINSAGKYEWQNTIGGINIENCFSIQPASDSGFILCGYTNELGTYDAYIVKTDSQGNFQWQKTFGGTDWDFTYWAEQTNDGGYILAGETYSFGNNAQAYLVKTNSSGDTLWTKAFGNSNEDVFNEVHQTSDGGFIAGGYTRTSLGDLDFYLLKTNSQGNWQWDTTFGGTADDACNSLTICMDGGFLLGGYSIVGTLKKKSFIKTNAKGNLLNSNIDIAGTGNREIFRIRENKEGEYYTVGWTDAVASDGKDISFDKWNTGYGYLGGGTTGGQYDEEAYDILETSDSGYVLVGYTGTYGTGTDNIIIVRMNKNMNYNSTINSYVSVNELAEKDDDATIFPNPTQDKFYFSLNYPFSEIRIFNLLGESVFELKNAPSSGEINISFLPVGIYTLDFFSKELSARKKIILVK